MNESKPFAVDIGQLKSRPKDSTPQAIEKVDRAGAALGFDDRSSKGRRGRKPSPRTGQVHARVMPNVAEEIAEEARRRGVQQGVVLEEAWSLYQAQQGREGDKRSS